MQTVSKKRKKASISDLIKEREKSLEYFKEADENDGYTALGMPTYLIDIEWINAWKNYVGIEQEEDEADIL